MRGKAWLVQSNLLASIFLIYSLLFVLLQYLAFGAFWGREECITFRERNNYMCLEYIYSVCVTHMQSYKFHSPISSLLCVYVYSESIIVSLNIFQFSNKLI